MRTTVQEKAFLLLLVAVSLALAWILSPVAGAILWATIFAILFAPLIGLVLLGRLLAYVLAIAFFPAISATLPHALGYR